METLTINLKSKLAFQQIKEMEELNLIHIANTSNSYVLNGEPMELDEFNDWIMRAEASPKLTIEEAKLRWEKKKKEIFA
jgi:hypothetical protein